MHRNWEAPRGAIAISVLVGCAALGGCAAPVEPDVVDDQASWIEVVPMGSTVLTSAGDTARFRAVIRNQGGDSLGSSVTWSVEDFSNCGPPWATIDAAGLVTAQGYGRVSVDAQAGELGGGAWLDVASDNYWASALNDSGQILVSRTALAGAAVDYFIWSVAEGLVDLRTLGLSGSASFINAAGHLAGGYLASDFSRVFLWTPSAGRVDVAPIGGTHSYARGLNDVDQVVGEHGYLPFVWTATTGLTVLPLLGYSFGDAHAINNQGQIVGHVRVRGADYLAARAVLWTLGGGVQELALPGGQDMGAVDINDAGHILGIYGGPPGGAARAFFWDRSGSFEDLGPVFGSYWPGPKALNNHGEVALTANQRAVLWTESGGFEDLGTIGGTWSTATAINDLGHVIGVSEDATCRERAFLWTPAEGMRDILTIPTAAPARPAVG